jgi:SAM-dependent methyltransferase
MTDIATPLLDDAATGLAAPGTALDASDFPLTGARSFRQYLELLRREFAEVYARLAPDRIMPDVARAQIADLQARSWEFEEQAQGGRGVAYNVAQEDPTGRASGMLALLRLLAPSGRAFPPEGWVILDTLGGDGTVARLCKAKGIGATIVSGDLSGFMVDGALDHGLPAIRQAAGWSFFADASLDGILVGYGTHHLDDEERTATLREAMRTLKPGRRVVLHDFENGGTVARWFEQVVDPFSRTGHAYPHFSRGELVERFTRAGFRDVRILDVADPFQIAGETPQAARDALLDHLRLMYDLVHLDPVAWRRQLEDLAESTLGAIVVQREGVGFVASLPRTALVAVGTKHAD